MNETDEKVRREMTDQRLRLFPPCWPLRQELFMADRRGRINGRTRDEEERSEKQASSVHWRQVHCIVCALISRVTYWRRKNESSAVWWRINVTIWLSFGQSACIAPWCHTGSYFIHVTDCCLQRNSNRKLIRQDISQEGKLQKRRVCRNGSDRFNHWNNRFVSTHAKTPQEASTQWYDWSLFKHGTHLIPMIKNSLPLRRTRRLHCLAAGLPKPAVVVWCCHVYIFVFSIILSSVR